MPKRAKVRNTNVTGLPKRKVHAYAVLYHVNEEFEQILAHLQELNRSGALPRLTKPLRLIVEETRAQVNFELVESLQELELRDWTRLGAARQSAETGTKRAKG